MRRVQQQSRGRGARRVLVVAAALALVGGMLTGCDLPAGTALGGTVVTSNGATVGQVTVNVWADTTETQVAQAITDAGGNYRVDNTDLPAGTYRVRVGNQWYGNGATDWSTAAPVTVTADDPTRLDVTLTNASDVTGTVVDPVDHDPVSAVGVTAMDSGGNIEGLASTAADGSFDVGSPPGVTVTIGLIDHDQALATLGGADPTEISPTPGATDDIGTLTIARPVQAAAGVTHTCVVESAGTVSCWGDGSHWQLGQGTLASSSVPLTVTGIDDVTQVVAGSEHSCALQSDGEISCWGANTDGQLGTGSPFPNQIPVAIPGVSDATQIASGTTTHTCAIRSQGAVWCWGNNYHGQLGDGTTDNRAVPVRAKGVTGAIQVTVGGSHTCALLGQDGTVKCWGANESGQLGDGTTTQPTSPVTVPGLVHAKAISAGNGFTCALTEDHTVSCWGANDFGQLGDGTTTDSLTPVTASHLGGVTQLAGEGANHTCALQSGGKVFCWGLNNYGQLGNSTTNNPLVPKVVNDLTDATSIDVGIWYSCATRANGTMSCWGYNGNGQLGNGSTNTKYEPASVVGLPRATAVAP